MLQQQVYILNTVLMILDALCLIGAGYGAFYLKYTYYDGMWHLNPTAFNLSVLTVMVFNNYVMGKMGLYGERRPGSYPELAWRVLKTVVVDFALLAAGVFILGFENFSRFFLLAFMALSFVSLFLFRAGFQLYLNHAGKRAFNLRNILVVGDGGRGRMVAELLDRQLSMGHKIIGRLTVTGEKTGTGDVLGKIEDFAGILRSRPIDEVVFAISSGNHGISLKPYLDFSRKMGIPVRILPAMWEPGDPSLSVESCQKVPFLTLQVDNFNATGLLYKRTLDIIGGAVGSLIVGLLYPALALAIKLDSPGPVIFRQKRMGRHGRVFELYKFRSMYQDAEARKADLVAANEVEGAMFKMDNDPRITRVGRFLRSTSLDEFPQFLNVLKGEMSLVGTRPPTLDEVRQYDPRHLKRISAKPGITGLWQVSGRSRIKRFEEVVALDCRYLDSWRFSDDIKILLKTVWVVLARKGAA
ncbi:MAG: sugar transferase [Desulfobacterales bacterium]